MSRQKGNLAEEAAAAFLQRQGYTILARNYTVRGAEVDLIAREGDTIAFVEVKHRKSSEFGAPREAVTHAKRKRICAAALRWLQENNLPEAAVRFDIVESTPQGLALLRAAFDYTP